MQNYAVAVHFSHGKKALSFEWPTSLSFSSFQLSFYLHSYNIPGLT